MYCVGFGEGGFEPCGYCFTLQKAIPQTGDGGGAISTVKYLRKRLLSQFESQINPSRVMSLCLLIVETEGLESAIR